MDDPDLTAELDAAEDIVTGRVESVEVQWGVRYEDGRTLPYGNSRTSERMARLDAATDPGTVVRRTVTYGPWEDVPRV